jgi:hypothetical protein
VTDEWQYWPEKPTRESIYGTCQSCRLWSRDGERAWWGDCHRKATLVETGENDSCKKYEESAESVKEAIDRWMQIHSW